MFLRIGVPLTSPVLSQWVQCVTEGEAGPPPSKNQCCPGARWLQGHVQCLPCVCPGPPPRPARGLRGSGHRPAGRAGAARRERRGPAPEGAPVPHCLSEARGRRLAPLAGAGSPELQGGWRRAHAVLSASSARKRCSWAKGGRCSGSRLQHRSISSYRPRGQAEGRDRYTYGGAGEEGEGQMLIGSCRRPRLPPPRCGALSPGGPGPGRTPLRSR